MGTPSWESPGFPLQQTPILRWVPMFNFRGVYIYIYTYIYIYVYELRKEGKTFSRSKSLLPNIDCSCHPKIDRQKKYRSWGAKCPRAWHQPLASLWGRTDGDSQRKICSKTNAVRKNNMLWLLWLKYFLGIKTEISCLFRMSFFFEIGSCWNRCNQGNEMGPR